MKNDDFYIFVPSDPDISLIDLKFAISSPMFPLN